MEVRKGTEEERRTKRKKRKQRNQVFAYGILLILLAGVCILTVSGVKIILDQTKESVNQQESNQEVIEDMLAGEEAIEIPETAESVQVSEISIDEKRDLFIDEKISQMTLEDKVAGLFFVTPESITGVNAAVQAGEGTRTALQNYAVGGLIYFQKNIKSSEQIAEMISNSQSYSKYPLFIGVDEEGGSVSRIAAAGLAPQQPATNEIGASEDVNVAYLAGTQIGTYLRDLGFNVNFAPVADLANVEDSIMYKRAYGSDASKVAPFVVSMLTGLEESGITGCLKHFPGIGSTTSDTHDGLASVDRTLEEFRSQEFEVFKAGIEAGANMIMVGHVNVPELDDENYPASMSRKVVTEYLRNELEYNGVIITDALNMSAISEYYSSEQAAIMALKAGCDMLLMPENFLQAYAGVVTAVTDGTISEERINDSLKRIYRIKYAEAVE